MANTGQMLLTSVPPAIGKQWVDRTARQRLEPLFQDMAARDYATSTIDRIWNYLNQALQFAVRQRMTKTNPAAGMLLPRWRCTLRFAFRSDRR